MARNTFTTATTRGSVVRRFWYLAAVLLNSGSWSMSQGDPAYAQTTSLAKKAAPKAADKAPRQAIPTAAELQTVQLQIQEVYGSEIQKADKPAEKDAVADKLLKSAQESESDAAVYYALLSFVRELSIGSGNLTQARSTSKLLVEHFELDPLEESYQLLKKCGETFGATAPALLEVANASLQMAEDFSKQGDSEQALRFSRIAHAAATKARAPALLKQITALGTELAARETERLALPAAEKKLVEDPNDPTANMTLGRWYWFRMNDPLKGMSYLAKTAESPLKKAALAELEKPATADAQLALADQWWALAQVVKEESLKKRILTRAVEWYQAALPALKGLDKIKAEKRLAEIEKLIAPKTPATSGQPAIVKREITLPKTVKTSLGAELVLIPAGKFVMGSPKTEEGRRSDLENQVEVELSRSFYMGKCEVTQGEWKALMGTEPWKPYAFNLGKIKLTDDLPAVFVSHGLGPNGQIVPDSAADFCQKLSQRERKKYRLPTEAEWEYACRGGTNSAYCFGQGDAKLEEYANYSLGGNGERRTIQPVGSKKPNPFGLYDMHGNLSEFCSDWFNSKNAKLLGGLDPQGPAAPDEQELRVVRGGHCSAMSVFCRSAHRDNIKYTTKSVASGFRVVLELDPNQLAIAAAKPVPSKKETPKLIKTGLDAELIYIPPGKFQMGSRIRYDKTSLDERQVDVEITRGFYMGKYEVTQGEWKALLGTEPWMRDGKPMDAVKLGDDYPAVHIRHGHDPDAPNAPVHPASALNFLQQLSKKDGRAYRLPTEAEWEYACRAGTEGEYSFGDDATKLEEYAWWGGEWKRGSVKSERYAHQVGKKLPNPWGLFDMHGNATEWCLDPADEKLIGGRDPLGSKSRNMRAIRGGSWFDEPLNLRSAARRQSALGNGNWSSGFRIVMTAP